MEKVPRLASAVVAKIPEFQAGGMPSSQAGSMPWRQAVEAYWSPGPNISLTASYYMPNARVSQMT